MKKLFFLLLFIVLLVLHLFSQDHVAIKAQKRFEKYIQRHEKKILPKVVEQLPISIDSCAVYYIFEVSSYKRHDSIFFEDYQYPRFLKVHKPIRGYNKDRKLAYIETFIFSPATNRYFLLGGEADCCKLYEDRWISPDTIMMSFMKQNNICYCIKYGFVACCVLYNNNLWVSDGKKMIPFNEFLTQNWNKFSFAINDIAFIQHEAKKKVKPRKYKNIIVR